jgi:hypothetical protein
VEVWTPALLYVQGPDRLYSFFMTSAKTETKQYSPSILTFAKYNLQLHRIKIQYAIVILLNSSFDPRVTIGKTSIGQQR